MDISDVDAVIVNAPPPPRHTGTVVPGYRFYNQLNMYIMYPLQMFGRAGRNGCPARAHLLCSNRHAEKVTDQVLQVWEGAKTAGAGKCSDS